MGRSPRNIRVGSSMPCRTPAQITIDSAAVFSERELGQVIAMALTINAWNRIGVTTRLSPPKR